MPGFRTISTFLTYTPSATSADANFPATNLGGDGKGERYPFRPWKALVQNAIVDVTIDFGVGKTLSSLAADPALFVNPSNLTFLKIQGNSTPVWTAPPWNQSVSVLLDPLTGRYKGFWRLADLNTAAFAYRYLNLSIPAQATTDGAVYRIGSVVVGHAPAVTTNPSYVLRRRRVDPSIIKRFSSGGREMTKLGEPFMEFEFPRRVAVTAAATQIGVAQIGVASIGGGGGEWVDYLTLDNLGFAPFVLWDASLSRSVDAWMVQRTADVSWDQPFLNLHESSWQLTEVV